MKPGDIRRPSSAIPVGGTFVVPCCHLADGVQTFSFSGFIVMDAAKKHDGVVCNTREQAQTYAKASHSRSWKALERAGFSIMPVRVAATRIDA